MNPALRFLWMSGPHTMGPIRTRAEFATAAMFVELVREGLARSTNFGGGYVQFVLSPAGAAIFAAGCLTPPGAGR